MADRVLQCGSSGGSRSRPVPSRITCSSRSKALHDSFEGDELPRTVEYRRDMFPKKPSTRVTLVRSTTQFGEKSRSPTRECASRRRILSRSVLGHVQHHMEFKFGEGPPLGGLRCIAQQCILQNDARGILQNAFPWLLLASLAVCSTCIPRARPWRRRPAFVWGQFFG